MAEPAQTSPLAITAPGRPPAASAAASAASAAAEGGDGATLPTVFVPTAEWRVIGAGQMIPGGIEVNIDMQTGLRQGRSPPE